MENSDTDFGPRKKHAIKLAQDLIKDSRVLEAPVSLQKVIEYLQTKQNLTIQKYDFGQKISGLMVQMTDDEGNESTVIGFNENHPWCRRRFTLAHEIGHLLLGHTCNNDQTIKSHEEKEADIFASELLVPKSLLKKDFQLAPNIPALSFKYRVSQQSIGIKIQTDHLL
jgi:Zn-dependent peptidase ImmA (M78 family)